MFHLCACFVQPQLNSSESMEQQMGFLNKQLLLLGEANKLYVEEIERLGPEASKVRKMVLDRKRLTTVINGLGVVA